MIKIKSFVLTCLCVMFGSTIFAKTVSFKPDWEIGDKADFSVEQKTIKNNGPQSSTSEVSFNLGLKVVAKDANGYTLNATFDHMASKDLDDMDAMLLKLAEGMSFDYKLDANGLLLGLVDSAKVRSDMKTMFDSVAKNDSIMASWLQILSYSGGDDIYLMGSLDKIAVIHSLNGLELSTNKPFQLNTVKSTLFGFDVTTPTTYLLESVNSNVANVKSTTYIGIDDILSPMVDLSMKMVSGIVSDLTPQEVASSDDLNKIRAEIEKTVKERINVSITQTCIFSYDKATQWVSSISGSYVLMEKKDGQEVNEITEVKITKK